MMATTRRAGQAGFSLMELMVGMALGLVIIGAALTIFMSGRLSSATAKEQSRLEDATRYVQRMMQSEVGQAGFFGCVSRGPTVTSLLGASTYLYNFAQPVYGHYGDNASFSPALDASLPVSGAVPDKRSDVLVVRGASSRTYSLVGPPYPAATGAGALVIRGGSEIKNGDLIAASNCSKTVIFTNTAANCPATGNCSLLHAAGGSPAPGNSSVNLGVAFAADSEISLPITSVYYIANSSRCLRGALQNCPSSSLWRKRGSQAPQEMVEGVERMKISYRIDNGIRGGGRSLNAAQVEAGSLWDKVVGIEARFVVASLSAVGVGSQVVDGQTYTDRRARRLVRTTVNLRNLNP